MIQKNQVSDDVRNVFRRLAKYWKLYPVMLVLFVAIAVFYVRIKPAVHELGAQLVVHTRERGTADPSTFMEGSELFAGRNSFENSLLTLQASPIIRESLSKFSSRIEYYESNRFFDKELYKSSPFSVVMDESGRQLVGVPFELEILSEEKYRIRLDEINGKVYDFVNKVYARELEEYSYSEVGEFGKPLESEHFRFTLFLENDDMERLVDTNYKFTIMTDDQLVSSYKNRLVLEPASLEGTAVDVTFRTGNAEKGMDFLNAYVETVIDNNLERKNHIANTTIGYIDSLLAMVSDSLNRSEQALQQYQSNRNVMDVSESSRRLQEEQSRIEEQTREYESNVEYLEYLADRISQDDDYTEYSMSAVMSLENNSLQILMEEYISLVAQRNRLIGNEQLKSPLLKQVESRISNLRRTIHENVRYSLNTAQKNLRNSEERLAEIEQRLRELPETQRNMQNYTRDFRLNDDTYTYLMQKKAESQIARSSNLPDYEVFDPPSYSGRLSPKSNRATGFAIFLALFFSTTIALVYDNVFGKIKDEKDFLGLDNVRFLGELMHVRSQKKLLGDYQFSAAAESFRTLRSHVLAFCKNGSVQSSASKLILVTSSVQGEGKTFTSYYLARAFARLERPTLLVELDLRRPRLVDNYMPELHDHAGLVDFVNGETDLKNIIYPTSEEGFFLIPAGSMAPNPSEILESEKFRELLDEVKKHFDYVILDSAPLIVADTRATLSRADAVLMVSRAGYTPIHVMRKTMASMQEFKSGEVGVVLNDVTLGLNRRYYNYKYGYRK
ncbi:MAG: polysaccharide biosynthesis tyrosine autokinase [Marinilabiliaceae bacterium]